MPLVDATVALLAWADQHGIAWQTSAEGRERAACLEFYLTDPDIEPDMNTGIRNSRS